MTKAELESKHLAELHTLAEEAGMSGYRMLSRDELIGKLAGGESKPREEGRREAGQRQRRPRERRPRERRDAGSRPAERGPSKARAERSGSQQAPSSEAPQPAAKPKPSTAPATTPPPGRPKRRRRRRFRRRKSVRVQDLLLPAGSGRQTIVYAETREGCTALLRELAAELSGAKGPDPVALLIDPSPEELADWKREAPAAEIVAAGQERHAEDALAQAARRAEDGEAVFLLIDSISRHVEAFGDGEAAKELFDGGLGSGAESGSLTVVAALERQ